MPRRSLRPPSVAPKATATPRAKSRAASAAPGRASSTGPGPGRGRAAAPGEEPQSANLTWRNKTALGLFCDPYIGHTNLEGGYSSDAINDVVQLGEELLGPSKLSSCPAMALELSAEESRAFRRALDLLQQASQRSEAGKKAFGDAEETEAGLAWSEKVLKQLLKLEIGGHWLSEGGWRGESGGHAIMYFVERMSDENFAFTVLNTGSGIHQFHLCDPSSMQVGKTRYQTAYRLYPVREDCLSSVFLYTLFKMYYVRHRSHSCSQLYEVLLPTLQAPETSGSLGFTTPQRAGTCYAKCVFLALRYLLATFGVGREGRRKIMLNYRIRYLEKIVEDFPKCKEFTASDRMSITIALKQTSRRCVRNEIGAAVQLRVRGVLSRVHGCLQKVWLVAAPLRWLGDVAGDSCSDILGCSSSIVCQSAFQGFTLLSSGAFVSAEVRNAFAGPTAGKTSAAAVDLTGIASAIAEGGGPTLKAVLQAALTCDRLEEVLSCSWRAKHLIAGVVEELVFSVTAEMLPNTSLRAEQSFELLEAIHRLGAHYLAAIGSRRSGRCSSAQAVLVLAALLDLYEKVLFATPSSNLTKAALEIFPKDVPLWSLRPWGRAGSSADTFGTVTSGLPMISPAMLRLRLQLCRRDAADTRAEGLATGLEATSKLLFGPPQGSQSALGAESDSLGLGVNLCDLAQAVRKQALSTSTQPSGLPAVERPYQDWEHSVAWVFDPALDKVCPEWRIGRNLAIFYQMVLGSVPDLSAGLNGRGSPSVQGRMLSVQEVLECSFQIKLFNPPVRCSVSINHAWPLKASLCDAASLAHPSSICSGLQQTNFGGALENTVLSLQSLPHFNFALTQAQAETLLSILGCPGLRIPLLLQFIVPNHVALLHDREFQRVFFACLFEPGTFPSSSSVGSGSARPAVAEPELATIPASRPLSVELGWLTAELDTSPHLLLPAFHQLFLAMRELGSGACDGPLVQPFLFIVRVAAHLQDFIAVARTSATGANLSCLDEHAQLFRRFTQKFARRVIARWLRQANASKNYDVLLECNAHLVFTSWPLRALEVDDVQSLASAACSFSLWSEQIGGAAAGSKHQQEDDAGDTADKAHAVFATLSKQRVSLLRAVEGLSVEERDRLFSFILGGAIGVERMPSMSWRATSQTPTVCSVSAESNHPITSEDFEWRNTKGRTLVSLPGASRIIIRFDAESELETGDVIKVHAGRSDKATVIWTASRSDIAKKGWPGVDAPALSVEGSDTFLVRLTRIMPIHDDHVERVYGWRLVAEAELQQDRIDKLRAKLGARASNFVCASILAEVGGNVEKAARLYQQADCREKWEDLESQSEARQDILGLSSNGSFEAAAAETVQDAWLRGAKVDLGVAALRFESRDTLRPMPAECFEDQDYFAALGTERPNVLPTSDSLYRRVLSFRCQGVEYSTELWSPPSFTVGLDYSAGVKLGSSCEVPFVFSPRLASDAVFWRGQSWSKLSRGQVVMHLERHFNGSGADVISALLSTPAKDLSLMDEPKPWGESIAGEWWNGCNFYGRRAGSTVSDCQAILLCEYRAQTMDGWASSWLELEALPSEAVVAYRILEHSRSAMRAAVWTSDWRRSLFCCDPPKRYNLYEVPQALRNQAGDLSAHLASLPKSLVLRSAAGTFLPCRFLAGLLPQILLENFTFWQVSGAEINGIPKNASSRWFGYSLKLVLRNGLASVERVEALGQSGEASLDAISTASWRLLDASRAPAGSDLFALGQELSLAEPLSQVLLWAEPGGPRGDSLGLVEMPRLQLRFRMREGPATKNGKVVFQRRLYCEAHGGRLFLHRVGAAGARHQLPNCHFALPPHSLLLMSESGEGKLIAPLGELWRPRSYPEPFSVRITLNVCGTPFLAATTAYDLAIATGTDLKCPSLLAALWLLVCRLLQRDYEGAAKLMPFVATADGSLRQDESRVYAMALKDKSDRSPDAVAIRLRLVHASLRWVAASSSKDMARAAFSDAFSYISHITHVSQSCCLTPVEEAELWTSLLGMKSDKESTNRLISWRRDVLLAREGVVELKWTRVDPRDWWSTVLDEEEHSSFVETVDKGKAFSEIDCISAKVKPLLTYGSKSWPDLLESVHAYAVKDGLFATLLQMWEKQQSPEHQRFALRILLFTVSRGAKSLDRSLLLVLHVLQTLWPTGPRGVDELESLPKLKDLEDLTTGQGTARMRWFQNFFACVTAYLRRSGPGIHLAPTAPTARWSAWPSGAWPLAGASATSTVGVLPRPVPRSASDFGCHEQLLKVAEPAAVGWPVLTTQELEELGRHSPCLALASEDVGKFLVEEPLLPVPWIRGLRSDWKSGLETLEPSCGINRETIHRWLLSASAFEKSVSGVEKPRSQIQTTKHGGLTRLLGSGTVSQEILQDVLADIERLLEALQALVHNTVGRTREAVDAIMAWSRRPLRSASQTQREVWDLEVVSGFHPPMLSFEWTIASVLAKDAGQVFASFLPSALDPASCLEVLNPSCLVHATLTMLFLATRVAAAQRALVHTYSLAALLRQIVTTAAAELSATELKTLENLAGRLATELSSCEEFVEPKSTGSDAEGAAVAFDPHFLVFEWLFSKGNLRAGQLAMVRQFAKAASSSCPLVRQLLMGEGKSAVIAPLLSLVLASEEGQVILQVVPEQLLAQSLAVSRALFGQALFRPVYSLSIDRAEAGNDDRLYKILRKVRAAVAEHAVMCTAASAVKSCVLSFVECKLKRSQAKTSGQVAKAVVAQRASSAADWARLADLKKPEVKDGTAIDYLDFTSMCLKGILFTFREGVAILDEVDLLLHPLISELNFPVGGREPLDLAPERWELPMHLLSPILGQSSDDSCREWQDCKRALGRGLDCFALQQHPHVVLAIESFYNEHLESPFRDWLCIYLRGHADFQSEDCSQISKVLEAGDDATAAACARRFGSRSKRLLMLGREWLKHTLVFVLSKSNRVHYGLLRGSDVMDLESRGYPPAGTRLQMAVPFTGLDTPSIASEFANPDVAIGFTILAFAHEGMRQSDVKRTLMILKEDLQREAATPPRQREAFLRFQEWTYLEDSGDDEEKRDTTYHGVLPLDLIQPDAASIALLTKLWALQQPVCQFYLKREVFPMATPTQVLKLSTSAQELASSGLFKVRLGFSGTPTNVLPAALPPVLFDEQTDGQTLAILTSSDLVRVKRLGTNSTARSLIEYVASQHPPLCALIDTGALLCGLDNEEVARLLMESPVLSESMDACVFLARGTDLPMVLLKGASQALPLEDANVRPERRFCYFDQPHTTGIDIDQPALGVAAITIGKDMSIRELQQGAWRMRGLAKGQSLEMLLPQDVTVFIRDLLGDEAAVPDDDDTKALRDVASSLVLRFLGQEELQARQLVRQDLATAWRAPALEELLGKSESSNVSSLLATLVESVPTTIRDSKEGEAPTLEESMKQLAAPFLGGRSGSATSSIANAVDAAVARATKLLGTAKKSDGPQTGGEIVREQEQQQQREHQQESASTLDVSRPRLGEARCWEFNEKLNQILTVRDGVADNLQLVTFPRFADVAIQLGFAPRGGGPRAARALQGIKVLEELDLRFSTNSRPLLDSASAQVVRPVLIACQCSRGDAHPTTLTLSLAEAETVRWMLVMHNAPRGTNICLYTIAEAKMGRSCVAPEIIFASPGCATNNLLMPLSVLRFYLGEAWFSQQELQSLKNLIGTERQAFGRLRARLIGARRPGGAADWSGTPLASVLGDAESEEEEEAPAVPPPSFLQRVCSEDLAGGRDFAEAYTTASPRDPNAEVESSS